jgi:hypothetical protein
MFAAAFREPRPKPRYRPDPSPAPVSFPEARPLIVPPPVFACRVPRSSKSETYKPLKEVLERAAHRADESPQHMENLMSHFFEALVVQLTYGKVVTIPGIGRFAAGWWHPGRAGGVGHAIPLFIPARALRQELKATIPGERINRRSLNRYRKRNAIGGVKGRERERPFVTLQAQRKRLLDGDGRPPLSH